MEFAPSLDIVINETLPALHKVCQITPVKTSAQIPIYCPYQQESHKVLLSSLIYTAFYAASFF